MRVLLSLLACVLAAVSCASQANVSRPLPAYDIRVLRARLEAFAHDSMLGRGAGELGGLRAAEYVAGEFRALGLSPVGEGRSFFQAVPAVALTIDDSSWFEVDGRRVTLWRDFFPSHDASLNRDLWAGQFGLVPVNLVRPLSGDTVIYAGVLGDTASYISPSAAAGHVLLFDTARDSLGRRRYESGGTILSHSLRRAATGLLVAGAELMPELGQSQLKAEIIRETAPASLTGAPVIRVTTELGSRILGRSLDSARAGDVGRAVRTRVVIRRTPLPYPVRNVAAVLRGADPSLRNEYVVVGAHIDGQGAGERARRLNPSDGWPTDSIYNSADDNGSGVVAMLSVAQALTSSSRRPRRSVLFLGLDAEEGGLVGSTYFVRQPLVPLSAVRGYINLESVGRGTRSEGGLPTIDVSSGDGPAALLHDLADKANDDAGRPGFLHRTHTGGSDHMVFAACNVPVISFRTEGARDYHQVIDEPSRIDFVRVSVVARIVERLVQRAADEPAGMTIRRLTNGCS